MLVGKLSELKKREIKLVLLRLNGRIFVGGGAVGGMGRQQTDTAAFYKEGKL